MAKEANDFKAEMNHSSAIHSSWLGHFFVLPPNLILEACCRTPDLRFAVLVAQSCLDSLRLMDWSLPGFSGCGILQARILEWVAFPFSRKSSWPRDWTWVSHIAGRFLTIWGARKALFHWDSPGKNNGVGCHVLLRRIFPTQGLNPGLLHCRQILYQLSHRETQEYWSG